MSIWGFTALGGTDPSRPMEDRRWCDGETRQSALAHVEGPGAAAAAREAARVGDCLVAVHGSPRDTAAAQNPLSAVELGERYLTNGQAMLSTLCGGFALSIVDTRRRRGLLAIDRMGIGRLAYACTSDLLIFSDRVDRLARSPAVDARLSRQRLYDFLFFHMVPAPESAYEGISKLEPGTCLVWEDCAARVERYWRPVFSPDRARRQADFEHELTELLERAVVSAGPDDKTGAFLSGGLDSSSVAGYLQKVQRGPARTFSIGFGEPGYDELEFARIANHHFGCQGHEYNVTPDDVLETFGLIAEAYDEPFGNSSAVPVLMCARLARRHGIEHLLAGDGGDELFAGNERYAKQKVFEAYGHIPAVLRRRLIEPAIRHVPPTGGFAPLRKLRSYIDQAATPLPSRLETWNYAYREGMSTMLHPDFAASVDPAAPLRQMDEVYWRAQADDVVDRMLAYDWHFTLADSDLRKVSSMCELAGVKVSYPMLDHRLVELAMSIPAEMKLPGTRLRHFYKRAMRNFLPEAILRKRKHGFGLPVGKWLKSSPPLAELIYDRLHQLRQRQIFREDFIDELIAQQQAGHHAYYGFFLWDLAILEDWLSRQRHSL